MNLIKQDSISIPDIVSALKQGKTIVYPTETSYGLGCDATQSQAVNKIFEIKKRQKNKPVLVLVAEESMVMEYVEWNKILQQLSEKYWPGPVTVVTKTKGKLDLPSGVVSEDSTLAFRITDHPFASKLSKELNGPLVSTSANISAMESPYDIESVLDMFQNESIQPDIIIDAGELPHHSPSTVVKIVDDGIKILRQGEVVVKL